MTRINFSSNGETPFQKLIGHNEEILKYWNFLSDSIFEDPGLEPEMLEQVRRTLAFGNHCEYCMAKAGPPDSKKRNEREELATAFAELYVLDHKSIGDQHFDLLKTCFTEKEISELCSFIAFITASQQLGHIYKLSGEKQVLQD